MKNIQKNVIFSSVGYILPLLAALATIPIMVQHLGEDLYGLYAICISLVGFMTLVDLGVGQTIVKYVAEYEVTDRRQDVKPILDISLLIYLCIGLLAAGLLYAFSPNLSAMFYTDAAQQALGLSVLHLTAIALFFSYMNQFFVNVCKAYHRFDIPSIIQNVGNLGGIIISSVLLLLGFSLEAIMISYIVIYACGFGFGYWSCRRILPAGVHMGLSFNAAIFKDIVSFSFYTFISNLLASLTTRADKLVIGGIIGTGAVTYYQIPYTIAQMANGIIHTLVQIVFPRFSELSGLNRDHELLELYKKTTKIMLLISMVIAVLLISAGGEFLSIWLNPTFAAKSTLTLQIIATYFFFQSNIVTSYWLIQSKGNAKLVAWISMVGAILYFCGLYYLGKHYSYNGTALALFIILSPVPLWFIWLERHVGHAFSEYLTWLFSTAAVGALISYGLLQLNAQINNNLLAILADGFLVVGVPLLIGLLFRKSLAPTFAMVVSRR